jgi:CRP-like cAMP-binding protein
MEVYMTKGKSPIHWEALLAAISSRKTLIKYSKTRSIFRQGQPADSLFYLRRGKVKLTVISKQGKKAIIAVLGAGEFFGEGCLASQQSRTATAAALTDCTLHKIHKSLMARMLHEQPNVSELFVRHLLARRIQYEAALVDHLLNSSESRLAQVLLLLADYGRKSRAETVLPRVSQDSLAQMVGTTRPRIRRFMQKFRELGFIDYDSSVLTIHNGLLSMVLHP